MDIRDGIGLSGSASYYLSRGAGSGSGGGPPPAPPGIPVGFKHHPNPNIAVQANVRGGGAVSSAFQVEDPPGSIVHGISMGSSSGGGATGGDPVKKKRGRPRKYGPEGANMSLALSPMSSLPSPGSSTPGPKRAKGRPPGTGWKQHCVEIFCNVEWYFLDAGEWMNNSAGLAFTPYVIQIGVGEDIAAKVLAFAKQRPRALCILSANGTVSAVTLRPPASSGSTVTYEGRFEILCLSGSYLVSENGSPQNRTGGISISVCSPDGHVIGGAIGGRLIAASPVQVVVCSFVHGNLKAKSKGETSTNDDKDSAVRSVERSSAMVMSGAGQEPAPNPSMVWPPSSRADIRTMQTGIDLMRG
nr:AT-hook motif nuclear-localized protein 5-like [Ipomoea batatas]